MKKASLRYARNSVHKGRFIHFLIYFSDIILNFGFNNDISFF